MRPIVILGLGGHAKSINDLVEGIGYRETYYCDFLDKNDFSVPDNKVKSYLQVVEDFKNYDFVLGIGEEILRRKLLESIIQSMPNANFPSLIHENAYVSKTAKIGKGTVVFSGAYLGPNAVLGDWSVLNTNSVVEHDSRIGNSCIISIGVTVAGNVVIEDECFLGMGALVSHSITVGRRARIFAGSFVNKNVGSGESVLGIPGRIKIGRAHV